MRAAAELSFARTKIQPPSLRSDLISRPGLDAELQRALAVQRLTLILAPAGWGKTSALARQLSQLPPTTALAWVSADAEDDVPRFLAGLTAALEPLDLAWRVSPSALSTLLQADRGLRLIADEIINALSEADTPRGLIVIDDGHRWTEPRLFELLATIVDGLPASWGLVVASRTEPQLPLARLRARGELAEFRQGALRFDTDEVRALLQSHGLSADQAEELHRRTEGWAAGLRLMLSVGNSSGQRTNRSQRDVYDYLAEEVLEGMAPDLRQFLLRCSVLPELTIERSAHISQLPNAATLFEHIEREGLFVTPLDEAGQTLRLHDLFRDFLEARLRRDCPDELPGLLTRAADHEADLARAVTWLTSAGALDRAVHELTVRGPAMLAAFGHGYIDRLLSLFPQALHDSDPDLALLRGLCAFQSFDFDALVSAMSVAMRGYETRGRADMAMLARIYRSGALFNSGRADEARNEMEELHQAAPQGPPGALLNYFRLFLADMELRSEDVAPAVAEMLAQLELAPADPIWDGLIFFSVVALYPGAAATLERRDRFAATRLNQHTNALRASVLHVRATLALGRGQLQQAREWLDSADDDIEWLGRPFALHSENNQLHGLLAALAGDAATARRAAEQAYTGLRRSPKTYQRTHGDHEVGLGLRIYWLIGDADGVRRVRSTLYADANPSEWGTASIMRAMADGMVALLDQQNAVAEAALLSGAQLNLWSNCGLGIVCTVLAAEAQRRQGRLDAAAATLRPLLAHPHWPQVVGCALLAGEANIRSLAETAWGRHLSGGEQEQMRRLAGLTGDEQPAEAANRNALPAGLSAREAEVLELVSKGHSNKLIARDLSLSLFTVKRHVANMLGKTSLGSRTELAAWWIAQRRNRPTKTG